MRCRRPPARPRPGRRCRRRSAAPFSDARRSCCASASSCSATIVQIETGKPWKNAVAEVASSADLAVFMEGEGSRFYGKTMPSPILNRTVQTLRQPIGICAAIMPFNSPLAGIAWKAFPALLCGNAVVAKSHELTPHTAVEFGKLMKDAGLPAGVYSAVQGFGPDVGAPLVQDSRVGVVSFTGSSATGKLIQKIVSERAGAGEGLPRAGRQEPVRGVRRRRSRAGGGAGGGVGVHRRRAALRFGQPHHRVRHGLRRLPKGAARARRRRQGRLGPGR